MANNGNDVKSIVKDFVVNNYLYGKETVPLADDTSFLDGGIISSTGVLELIDFLEEEFTIRIENHEVIPENLDSFNNIEKFIKYKKNT